LEELIDKITINKELKPLINGNISKIQMERKEVIKFKFKILKP